MLATTDELIADGNADPARPTEGKRPVKVIVTGAMSFHASWAPAFE